jgi:hypothetical protein
MAGKANWYRLDFGKIYRIVLALSLDDGRLEEPQTRFEKRDVFGTRVAQRLDDTNSLELSGSTSFTPSHQNDHIRRISSQ